MKRFLAAVSLTIAGLAFVLGFKTRDPLAAEAAATQPTELTSAAGTATTSASTGTPAAADDPETDTTTQASSTTTGETSPTTGMVEADGPTVPTQYGPVQVAVVVEDGVLVDVVALQLPSGDRQNDSINSYAEPLLEEMALEAQSADIDAVSGATFTSRAYAESLQAALDEAGM